MVSSTVLYVWIEELEHELARALISIGGDCADMATVETGLEDMVAAYEAAIWSPELEAHPLVKADSRENNKWEAGNMATAQYASESFLWDGVDELTPSPGCGGVSAS